MAYDKCKSCNQSNPNRLTLIKQSPVVRSQGHSDPFAMFIENVVQPGRDLTTASRISKINRIKVDYQAWVRAGSRQETGR